MNYTGGITTNKNIPTIHELELQGAITAFHSRNWFLSNFYTHPIEYDGITFNTNEHAFVYAKLRSFGILFVNRKKGILRLDTPSKKVYYTFNEWNAMYAGAVKKLGRSTPPPHKKDLKDWDKSKKFDVMYDLIKTKFGKKSKLRPRLQATGTAPLIEGNTWNDTIWGAVVVGKFYIGENWLGTLLMKYRDKVLKD